MAFRCPEGCTLGKLDKSIHDRASFVCGEEALDEYLRAQARQDQDKSVSVTHVLARDGTATILGYCTIANADVPLAVVPKDVARKLSKKTHLPALLIARLAVHKEAQGQGFGTALLMYALDISIRQSENSGLALVIVDAKHQKAAHFYARYGFAPLHVPQVRRPLYGLMAAIGLRKVAGPPSFPQRMFLVMSTVRQTMAQVVPKS